MIETVAEKVLIQQLKNRLNALYSKDKKHNQLEPLTVIFHDCHRQGMERIIKTSHYLSNNRKVIYDLGFLSLYNHNLKIPEGCLAVGNWLLRIERTCSIENPEYFMEILDTPQPLAKGTCFYLDNILYMDNVPFVHAEGIRNVLLKERADGIVWFEVLKIVDPSGNKTLFYPSKKAQRVHAEKIK
jgi:hypothetical protein